jgi:hypothetical protein
MPGVVSVGLGQDAAGNTIIRVLVDPAVSDPALIPPTFGNLRVEVQFSDPAQLFHAPHLERMRPLRPGVSCTPAHLTTNAGTIGGLVISGDRAFMVSCNHVLAANDPAAIGLPIYQPAWVDGGNAADEVAVLTHYDPLEIGVRNRRDIAIAEVVLAGGVDIRPLDFTLDPLGIYRVPQVGDAVSKSGRTTGFTSGVVAETDVLINVDFGPELGIIAWSGTVRITGSPFVQGGDSGSWVYDGAMNMVGMVFAGNPSGMGWLINPLEVQAYLAEQLEGQPPVQAGSLLVPVLTLGGLAALGLIAVSRR